MKKGRAADVTSLDLCKTSDTVPHNTLVSKLGSHGSDSTNLGGAVNMLEEREAIRRDRDEA